MLPNPEEQHARKLQRELTARLGSAGGTQVSVVWQQRRWKCVVENGTNACHITCSDEDGVPKYYASFLRNSKTASEGSTSSQPELSQAVHQWLNDAPLSLLYEHFAWVDALKRARPQVERHYAQEDHARNLHHELTLRLGHKEDITVTGRDVNWKCTAQRGSNHCSISFPEQRGIAEYDISFKKGKQSIAGGRTDSSLDAVDAVEQWLQGTSLSQMYDRFPFIDVAKRAQIRLMDEIITRSPQLAELYFLKPAVVRAQLWFSKGVRSCRAYDYESPTALFYWEDTELFSYKADSTEGIVAPVERWVSDQATPSQMRTEFPWIEIGDLADYYQQGNSWEGECLQSWNRIEEFYRDPYFYPTPFEEMLSLLAQMRAKGYDKTLRAGQSMWTLVLSRSRKHGLRAGQAQMTFNIRGQSNQLYVHVNEEPPVVFPGPELTPELESLLQQLEATPID